MNYYRFSMTWAAQAGAAPKVSEQEPEPELAYSLDEEQPFTVDLDDIMQQLDDSGNFVEGATYYVADKVQHSGSYFTEGAAAEVVKFAKNKALDEDDEQWEEFGDGITMDAIQELNAAIDAWADKHLTVDFWTVRNIREAKVTADDVREYGRTVAHKRGCNE